MSNTARNSNSAPSTSAAAATHHRLSHMLGKAPRMQPPLTPMIDVTFQLLLFFLLTMQFRVAEGRLPAVLPATEAAAVAPVTPIEPIIVQLSQNGSNLVINIEQISTQFSSLGKFRATAAKLTQQLGDDQIPFIIRSDAGVDWQNALNVFNQLRLAGAENVRFDTETDPLTLP